jgi:hypothetical protein
MPDWLDFRLTKIGAAFSEFPALKYWSLFYVLLVILSAIFYKPILGWAYGFSYFGSYPFQNFIASNATWLAWGQFIVPIIVAWFCYLDVDSMHDEKYLKRHKQLPKWVN